MVARNWEMRTKAIALGVSVLGKRHEWYNTNIKSDVILSKTCTQRNQYYLCTSGTHCPYRSSVHELGNNYVTERCDTQSVSKDANQI